MSDEQNPVPSTSAAADEADRNAAKRLELQRKEFKAAKNTLYGTLQRKTHEDYRIGPALLDLDRAFRSIHPASVEQSEYDKMLEQTTNAINKGTQAMKALDAQWDNLQAMEAFEQQWRETLLKQQFAKVFSKVKTPKRTQAQAQANQEAEESADDTMVSAIDGENNLTNVGRRNDIMEQENQQRGPSGTPENATQPQNVNTQKKRNRRRSELFT